MFEYPSDPLTHDAHECLRRSQGRRRYSAKISRSLVATDTPSRNSIGKWIFKVSALPKRWIKVTAPVCVI